MNADAPTVLVVVVVSRSPAGRVSLQFGTATATSRCMLLARSRTQPELFRISICAHQARADDAHTLFDRAGAAHMAMDNGTLGCEANHRRCWNYHTKTTEDWAVVLEDDAVLCDNFTTQLEQVLTTAPTPVVGLYLGTSTPPHWQDRIRTAHRYHPDAHWYVTETVINAVAVAIKTELLPLQLEHKMPIDQALANWARSNRHKVGYCNPSIIQHKDEQPVIAKRYDGGERTQPRVAWNWGTRQRWTSRSAQL